MSVTGETARVLVAGCGDLGTALGHGLADDGVEVFGLRRRAEKVPAPIVGVAADLRDVDGLSAAVAQLPPLDAVITPVTADERTQAGYRATYLEGMANLTRALKAHGHSSARSVFVSSTAVYGQTDGSWVDEDSHTEPDSDTGRVLLRTEQAVLAGPLPSVIVRFGGIYGPGRGRLLGRVRRGEAAYPEVVAYTNRIHRDDCVGVLRHVLRLDDPASVYVGVDHDPCEKATVLRWLADRMGAPAPQVSPGEGRRGHNKRADNTRLSASGYRFAYPTFREGYAAVIAAEG